MAVLILKRETVQPRLIEDRVVPYWEPDVAERLLALYLTSGQLRHGSQFRDLRRNRRDR